MRVMMDGTLQIDENSNDEMSVHYIWKDRWIECKRRLVANMAKVRNSHPDVFSSLLLFFVCVLDSDRGRGQYCLMVVLSRNGSLFGENS